MSIPLVEATEVKEQNVNTKIEEANMLDRITVHVHNSEGEMMGWIPGDKLVINNRSISVFSDKNTDQDVAHFFTINVKYDSDPGVFRVYLDKIRIPEELRLNIVVNGNFIGALEISEMIIENGRCKLYGDCYQPIGYIDSTNIKYDTDDEAMYIYVEPRT